MYGLANPYMSMSSMAFKLCNNFADWINLNSGGTRLRRLARSLSWQASSAASASLGGSLEGAASVDRPLTHHDLNVPDSSVLSDPFYC